MDLFFLLKELDMLELRMGVLAGGVLNKTDGTSGKKRFVYLSSLSE